MPAAVVRGILLTAGIIAALGLAAYENPEIQRWLDEQRRKLAQFLRSIGDELDPQTRREAEAFAFGASPPPVNHESTRAEPSATTTGTEANTGAVRRVPVQGSVTSEEREQRQRLGEEYLARRQQQMQEMQERRQATRDTISRSTSFDSMVDEQGHLKATEEIKQELASEIASSSNPFTDVVVEADRSSTPRPAVPPKIKLEEVDPIPVPESVRSVEQEPELPGPMPGSMPTTHQPSDLSYEEQLAIALSLSKEEGDRSAQMTHSGIYEQDLHQAIRLSLQDHQMDAISAPDPDISVPPSLAGSIDELYDVTPNLTRASLAQLNTAHPSLEPERADIFMDTSGMRTPGQRSVSPAPASSHTMSEAEMIDVEDQASDIISEDGIVTPDSWTEVGDSDNEMAQAA